MEERLDPKYFLEQSKPKRGAEALEKQTCEGGVAVVVPTAVAVGSPPRPPTMIKDDDVVVDDGDHDEGSGRRRNEGWRWR